MPFGTEKLEWLGYSTVNSFKDIFIRFDRMYERDRQTDRQTDGHCMTAKVALDSNIARQKSASEQPKIYA